MGGGAIKEVLEDIVNSGGEQVQSDWNQTNSTKPDYIKNKPNLSSRNYFNQVTVYAPREFASGESSPDWLSLEECAQALKISENDLDRILYWPIQQYAKPVLYIIFKKQDSMGLTYAVFSLNSIYSEIDAVTGNGRVSVIYGGGHDMANDVLYSLCIQFDPSMGFKYDMYEL